MTVSVEIKPDAPCVIDYLLLARARDEYRHVSLRNAQESSEAVTLAAWGRRSFFD